MGNSGFRRVIKEILARGVARAVPPGIFRDKRYFGLWERRGWHATPVHFYEPIPDTRALKEEIWAGRGDLIGIDLRPEGQIELLEEISRKFRSEYDLFPRERPGEPGLFYLEQDSFRSVDAEMLYGFVRLMKPRRIIEIGSGMSTLLIRDALARNRTEEIPEAPPPEHVIVDPFADPELKRSAGPLARFIELPVEEISLEIFRQLEAGDILFIDSSHVVRIGGDVDFLYLEVLPRLAPGVVVHAHDIFLPAEYPREWVMEKRVFWSEQYLLQAFLAFNGAFEVLWAASFMHLTRPERLEAAFGSYHADRAWPGSFWFRRSA